MFFVSMAALALPFAADPTLLDDNLEYRMGSRWQRTVITAPALQTLTPAAQRAAYATGIIGISGGTAFYLGKFGGAHLIVTNHHVCETGGQCAGYTVWFPLINRTYKMPMFVGTMKEVDLTILKIEVPAADEPMLAKIARNFSFKRTPRHKEQLFTLGFGATTPVPFNERVISINQDSDCKVFSKTGDIQQISDPDKKNPGPDRVWSFAHACDVTHGDSGSPILSTAGEILGILWTGATPKIAAVQDSTSLGRILNQPSSDLGSQTWSQLNYGVPATRIPQAVVDKTQSGLLDVERIQILLRLIDQSR
ncbi:MAG: trypsin-like peptidase domain-containing protein [Bdellovibrionales bacterium]|nr:trypsin-like peptidase domain-containing protein [Bdellovibrionales bacterium]